MQKCLLALFSSLQLFLLVSALLKIATLAAEQELGARQGTGSARTCPPARPSWSHFGNDEHGFSKWLVDGSSSGPLAAFLYLWLLRSSLQEESDFSTNAPRILLNLVEMMSCDTTANLSGPVLLVSCPAEPVMHCEGAWLNYQNLRSCTEACHRAYINAQNRVKWFFSFIFCVTGDWTQGPVHARQVLYHWIPVHVRQVLYPESWKVTYHWKVFSSAEEILFLIFL